MSELLTVLPCYRKGLPSDFPSTASLYCFRTRAEVDRYLEASQIRQRAIERITDVIGTIFSKCPDLFPEEVFNMETFRWSFGILFSRLVRLQWMERLPWFLGQICSTIAVRWKHFWIMTNHHRVCLYSRSGISTSSQCYPIQITGWPLELMACAYLAVGPTSMSRQFEEVNEPSFLGTQKTVDGLKLPKKYSLFNRTE